VMLESLSLPCRIDSADKRLCNFSSVKMQGFVEDFLGRDIVETEARR